MNQENMIRAGFLKTALLEIKESIIAQNKIIAELPAKILQQTDKQYATKIELQKLTSRVSWYAFITPILTGILAFFVGRYI